MTTLRERMDSNEFSAKTALGPPAIRAAGQRATEKGRRYLTNTISEQRVQGNCIDYVVKGPGGLVTQARFRVSWDSGDGTHTLRLEVQDFLTTQARVLFIPVGPKTAPARVPLERFSAALREELRNGAAA